MASVPSINRYPEEVCQSPESFSFNQADDMERHHPSEARGAGSRTMSKVSKDHHRREHHRSSKDLDRRAHKDPSRAEARPGYPTAKLPKENLEMALSGDSDYVRRWLAQTECDTNQGEGLVTRETSSEFISESRSPKQKRTPLADITLLRSRME